ncbi:uncharacterized protein LOC126756402, partial [Bactrocera neohumeralis]|uniref:uncharacterized protein LOC120771799 n=1 Tax=Bactrocera tryoni TaxID=59916 RepID=UPI001A959E49
RRLNGQMISSFANFVLFICSLCTVTDAAKLRESCEPLLNSTWIHLCNGVITKEIKIKYKDQLTTVGTPYKIMTLAKQGEASLITFFDSEIQNSTWIAINKNMTITLARSKEIKMKPKMFYCFNFGLEYMSDLLNLCFDQADTLAKLKCHCLYTVLHYSYMPPLVSAQVRLNADSAFAVVFMLVALFMSLIQMNRNHL